MTPTDHPASPAASARRPRLCEICGRLTEVRWHCISSDVDDQEQCSAAGGQGYWLCVDLCHETVHQKMQENPERIGRAGRAVVAVTTRAAGIVTGAGRRYRRRPATPPQEQDEEETGNGR